jgi:hypothetical protein
MGASVISIISYSLTKTLTKIQYTMVFHPERGMILNGRVDGFGGKLLCWGAQCAPYFECAIFFLLNFLIPTIP